MSKQKLIIYGVISWLCVLVVTVVIPFCDHWGSGGVVSASMAGSIMFIMACIITVDIVREWRNHSE